MTGAGSRPGGGARNPLTSAYGRRGSAIAGAGCALDTLAARPGAYGGAMTAPANREWNPAMTRWLALTLLACALALPALPVHADATDSLFEAAKGGSVSEVRAALAGGADPGARTEGGATPLHFAALKNTNPSVIMAFIEAGADVDARDGHRWTPLHYAARGNSNPYVILALIEAGADTGARTKVINKKGGATPLHLAALYNTNRSMLEGLLELGVDPGARDDAGFMPFDYLLKNPGVVSLGTYVFQTLQEAWALRR